MTLTIPSLPGDVTADWITAVLRTDGVLRPDQSIDSIRLEPVGEGVGVTSSTWRVRLDAAPAGVPPTLIVKLSSPAPAMREVARMLDLYGREVSFYRHAAASLAGRLPHCFHGASDRESVDHVLVLEDLVDHEPGDQLVGELSLVEATLDELAALHAAWWSDSDDDRLTWIESTLAPELVEGSVAMFHATFCDRWAERLGPAVMHDIERAAARVGELVRLIDRPPLTLAHGDARVDNVMRRRNGSGPPVMLIDWQLATPGHGAFDVAYLLGGSLPVHVRRAEEERLIVRYLAALRAAGVDVDEADWRHRFSVAAVLCVYLPIANGGGLGTLDERGKVLTDMMVAGHVALVRDHIHVLDTL